MFNRDNISNMNPFGARGSDQNRQQRPAQNFSRPQQSPGDGYDQRMGGYDTPPPSYPIQQAPGYGGASQRDLPRAPPGRQPSQQSQPQQQQQAGKSSPLSLKPVRSPGGNQFAFGNLVAVSTADFPPNEDMYLLLNGRYVVTARAVRECKPGEIGLTDAQRTWSSISLDPNEIVQVSKYDPFREGGRVYLGGADVMVSFAARKITDTPHDQEELGNAFTKTFENQVLSPGQTLIMDYKAVPLRLIVQSVQLMDLMMEKTGEDGPSVDDPLARGILTRQTVMNFVKDPRSPINLKASMTRPQANAILQPNFKFEDMGIGGLDSEFSTIFRRAFASRLFPPGLIQRMGLLHVRGMLLYGPPGTGKTLIARQIGKMLNAREPKIINGPEILNKYVGASEENVRKMFADAEKEYKEKGEDSGLHIIIFDELDAVCKQRGSGAGGGTGVGDSVVNQLLSKLDGVDQLNNILLIGMTNRKDMIDEALLRPGRLEVHVEISLPDEAGRVQILNIHTNNLKTNNLLSKDVSIEELARETKNYSGAEISGLVRAACSFAFTRHSEVGSMAKIKDANAIIVGRQDFENALDEMSPAFGVSEEDLGKCISGGIIHYSETVTQIMESGSDLVVAVRDGSPLLSMILHGPHGSGKTALAARLALSSDFPFIKFITPEAMVGFGDMQKIAYMQKIFMDSDKSRLSLIVVDDIEYLLDWVDIGPRFSTTVLSALRTLLRQKPPKDHRRIIIATTAKRDALSQLDLLESTFYSQIPVPNISSLQQLGAVLASKEGGMKESDARHCVELVDSDVGERFSIGVKRVLEAVRVSREAELPAEKCAEVLRDFMVQTV